jgi:hypothetical protein
MGKALSSVLAAISTAIAMPAVALDFNFSYTNVTGGIAGTVEGTIFGLADNTNNQSATSIVITSVPAAYTFPLLDGNDVTLWDAQFDNTFDVSNGMITSISFLASTNPPLAGFQAIALEDVSSFFGEDFDLDGNIGVFDNLEQTSFNGSPTFTPVPFEFEASLGLMALGSMFGANMYFKKRKTKKLAA